MHMTFSAIIEEFDQEKYMRAVREAVRVCFMKAGQKFLLAAIPRIPVWTGMARGAFRNAEDLFGKVTADKQSGGFRIRTTRSKGEGRGGGSKITSNYRKGYYYYPPGGGRIARTPQSGRPFATPTDKILDMGGATLSKGKMAFYFRFKVDLTYVDKLDPAKWLAFKTAEAVVEQYVRDNLVLPDPIQFMTRKQVKVG